MDEPFKILLVSCDETGHASVNQPGLVRSLQRALGGKAFELHTLSNLSQVVSHAPQLLLLQQEWSDGAAQLRVLLGQRWPQVPIVGLICIGQGCPDDLMEGFPDGLHDFVICPSDELELAVRIRRMLKDEKGTDRHDIRGPQRVRIESLVGESPGFQRQVAKIPIFAQVEATVLLQGETGTGKEVFARAIHYRSSRKDKAFIPVNCAALSDQLFENELFGHVKGAYTGAAGEQCGLVLEAEGGTLFLDEIDALHPYTQAKLLRFVQYREYRPLGCSRSRLANVRILAASNHDLQQAVTERKFREDLFHRLNVLSLVIPPLRHRLDDIPLLSARFLQRHRKAGDSSPSCTLSPGAFEKLLTHTWPGNVRELECTLQRAVVMSKSCIIQAQDIEFALEPPQSRRLNGSLRAAKTSAAMEVERAYLVKMLVTFRGNVTHAAKAAGKERRSFQRLLRKYGPLANA